MIPAAQNTDFQKKLDGLWQGGKTPSYLDIASAAAETALPVLTTLEALEKFSPLGRWSKMRESYAFTSEFISSLRGDAARGKVLEYANTPRILSAALFEQRGAAAGKMVVADGALAEAIDMLFEGDVVISSEEGLQPSEAFACIICQPPLGRRTKARNADGFGGEVVTELSSHLQDGGRLFWLTGRGAMFSSLSRKTICSLEDDGLHVVAELEIPSGVFAGAAIEGALFIFERRKPQKKLVGALRDAQGASALASALAAGPSKKAGASWAWLAPDDLRKYSQLEREDLLKRLTPRGRFTLTALGDVLTGEKVLKADKPIQEDSTATGYLYFPEYALSKVTAELDDQTVKPRAVYRLPVDTSKANPRFLAQLLNSPFGREMRAMLASGSTIPRVSVRALQELRIPLPPLETQNRIVRIDSDLTLIASSFDEFRDMLNRDWSTLGDIGDSINNLKAVLDIEQQIENWWRELPYPLATIYRRYQVASDPRERLDRLLHFFEMAAVYLAAIGSSHVKALRQDWEEHFAKWFHPAGAAGIERADFGFWIGLAGTSLKDLSRIASTPELRDAASAIAGAELVEVARTLGPLGKTTEILDTVRRIRNSWKGHGGHIKSSDATRLDAELQQSVRDFYDATSAVFRRIQLVRPGHADVLDSGYAYQLDVLAGSDPAFEKQEVELSRPAKSRTLAFWMKGSRIVCRALPFFRLGAPQEPQETSFYVFNRVENGGFRWISYQEAREQEFIASDDELHSLIDLPKGGEI